MFDGHFDMKVKMTGSTSKAEFREQSECCHKYKSTKKTVSMIERDFPRSDNSKTRMENSETATATIAAIGDGDSQLLLFIFQIVIETVK